MNTNPKSPLKNLTALLGIAALTGTASAATVYNWTGTNSNNLNDDGNWAGGSQPAGIGNDQPSTPAIDDTLVFDSDTWVRAPRRLYTRTNRKWGTIQLNNGSIDWANDGNNQGNYSWGGTTTMIVGDGDLTVAAVADFNVTNWNQGGTTGTKTYVINADGTLASARGGTHNWSNGANYDTVMRVIGGTVNINGILQESQIIGDADDYVSFEAIGGTFTFNKGGADQFDDAGDVTGAFGDSFRLGGSLNSGNAALELTDGGATWTLTAIVPEPGSLALLSLGGLLLGVRRRRG